MAVLAVFKSRMGVLSALYVDGRFVQNSKVYRLTKKKFPPRVRSLQYFEQIDVDELYSEVVLL